MPILFTIPHFFDNQPAAAGKTHAHGSQTESRPSRAEAFNRCIVSLHQLFGRAQSLIQIANRRTTPANQVRSSEIHVVVCTTGGKHLFDSLQLDPSLCQHFPTDVEPLKLGFQCHQVLRDRWGNYDYYCYLEDDLILHDPWLFTKLTWFNSCVGNENLLQPNRFELGPGPRDHKVYLDGDLAPHATARFQSVATNPRLESTVLGTRVEFRRTTNPHSGCFFLNREQMRHWINQPYFLDRDCSFIGPLESAATLGIMRAFKIYKPSAEFANFLEIEHHGRRFLDLIRWSSPA